jgi:hypothetical protein
MFTLFLFIAFGIAAGTAFVYRSQLDKSRKDLTAAEGRAEDAERGRDNWQQRARSAEANVQRLTNLLSASRVRASEAEALADDLQLRADELAEQSSYLTTSYLGGHDGPVVICDRRPLDDQKVVVLVRMGSGPGVPEDEQNALRRVVREGGGAMNADAEWRVDKDAWEMAVSNLPIILKRLPYEFGITRFFHMTSTTETCAAQCQRGFDWSSCKCACGGEYHGAYSSAVSRAGWHRKGWRLLRDEWKEHQFDLDPFWFYDEDGTPKPDPGRRELGT